VTVLYRRDYTVHFWGLISVQLSNKNCYLIQSDIVGLGEVFLTVSDWEKYFWQCRIGISISGSVGLGEVFLNGQVPSYIYIMYHNFSFIPFIYLYLHLEPLLHYSFD